MGFNSAFKELIVLGAGIECDCYQIADAMYRAEYKEQKNDLVSVVKVHLYKCISLYYY